MTYTDLGMLLNIHLVHYLPLFASDFSACLRLPGKNDCA